jgi:hypothetical protein
LPLLTLAFPPAVAPRRLARPLPLLAPSVPAGAAARRGRARACRFPGFSFSAAAAAAKAAAAAVLRRSPLAAPLSADGVRAVLGPVPAAPNAAAAAAAGTGV